MTPGDIDDLDHEPEVLRMVRTYVARYPDDAAHRTADDLREVAEMVLARHQRPQVPQVFRDAFRG